MIGPESRPWPAILANVPVDFFSGEKLLNQAIHLKASIAGTMWRPNPESAPGP